MSGTFLVISCEEWNTLMRACKCTTHGQRRMYIYIYIPSPMISSKGVVSQPHMPLDECSAVEVMVAVSALGAAFVMPTDVCDSSGSPVSTSRVMSRGNPAPGMGLHSMRRTIETPPESHLSRPQHIVEILEKGLLHDLGVTEQEHGGDVLGSSCHQHRLQIVMEFRRSIAPRDFDAYAVVAGDKGREPRQRSAPRP